MVVMSTWMPAVPRRASNLEVYLNHTNGSVGSRLVQVPTHNASLDHPSRPPYIQECSYLDDSRHYNTVPHVRNKNSTNPQIHNQTLIHSQIINNSRDASFPMSRQFGAIPADMYQHTQPNGTNTASITFSQEQNGVGHHRNTLQPTGWSTGGLSTRSSVTSNSWLNVIAEQKIQQNKGKRRGSGPKSSNHSQMSAAIARVAAASSHKTAELNGISKVKLKDSEKGKITDISSDYTSSYSSIFMQIREVNRESAGEWEFLVKSLKVLQNTPVSTIVLVLVLLLPIGMVILGVKYLHSCPAEPFLPIYLLVGGCFGTLKMFTHIWRQIRERKSSRSFDAIDNEHQTDFVTDKSTELFTDTVLTLFLLAWFIYGNYLTWRIYMPAFSSGLHSTEEWCEKSLYMFSLAQIIICYSIIGIFMLSTCCLCCARHVCCFADKHTLVGRMVNCEK